MRSAKRPHRPEAEFFADPQDTAQRRYEALRAYFLEGATAAQAAARFGYAESSVQAMVRDFRAGDRDFFARRRPARAWPPPSRPPATRCCGCAKPAIRSPRSSRHWPPPPRR